MTAEEDTRRVVEGYFAAWTSNKVDEAYALLADDLAFWGPTASYQSAAAFRLALTAFSLEGRLVGNGCRCWWSPYH